MTAYPRPFTDTVKTSARKLQRMAPYLSEEDALTRATAYTFRRYLGFDTAIARQVFTAAAIDAGLITNPLIIEHHNVTVESGEANG